MATKTTFLKRLDQLEDEITRLKINYLANQAKIPEDDPRLVEEIVREVRRVRKARYASQKTKASSLR